MSAENWAVCPKCKIRINAEADEKLKAAQDAYGVASAEKYMSLLDEAKKPVMYGNSLREDYWIGTDEDGDFEVSYSCSCKECGFSQGFKHGERWPMETKRPATISLEKVDN